MNRFIHITFIIIISSFFINAENLNVLIIGSDSQSEIPEFLDQSVSNDPTITSSTITEFYTQSDILQGYYAGRTNPSDSTAFLDKLNEGFDVIVIIPDEEKIFKYPGSFLEEVRLVKNRVSPLGSQVLIPMIWGNSYANIDANQFEEHIYRIGDALEVSVLPSGLAWNQTVSEVGPINNSNPNYNLSTEASYLLAISIYSEIFQQSASNSTYTPSGLNATKKNAIINNTYSHWTNAPLNTHYSGEYTQGYCSPNQIQYDVNNTKSVFMGSSTESGYGGKYKEILTSGGYNAGRTHISRYDYSPQSVFPYLMDSSPTDPGTPEVRDVLANTHFDFGFARFYNLNASHILDFQSTSMNSEIPFIGYMYQAYPSPNFTKQLNIINSNLKSGANYSYSINEDLGSQKVFHLPAEIAWGRLWETDPSLVEFKGVHVSDQVDAAAASMLYTMLSNQSCTSFGNPGKSGPYHAGYELAQNIGYRIIQEMGSLKKVPYNIANTKPASVISSSAHDLAHINNYGGGVFYYLDQNQSGTESISLDGSSSFDYEGSITSHQWSYENNVISTSPTYNTELPLGTHFIHLNTQDDLAQTSPTSMAIINILNHNTIVFDEMEQAINGGYGWQDSSWQWDGSSKVRWDNTIYNKGFQSLNVQNSGTVSRSIDLSAENGNLFLEFSYYAKSFETGEYALVEVFDGAWHTLLTISDVMDDKTWHDMKFDLAGFNMSNDFQIKFTLFGNANNDDLFIDSIQVSKYHLPVAESQNLTTEESTPIDILLSASDEDGDHLSYSIIDQPSNGTLSGTAPNFSYTPTAGFVGSDSFTFEVNDGDHNSNLATVSITIQASNLAPIANAGADQNLADLDGDGSELVTLDGSQSSDPDGSITSYIWEEGAVLLTTGETSTISLDPGEHNIKLTVIDNKGATASDEVLVSIEAYDPTTAPKLNHGVIPSADYNWQTITLADEYESMVVIATPQYNLSSLPLVTRIRNAQGNQFEIKVQNPSGNTTFDPIPVQYLVLEEGLYNEAEHGVKMEVVKYTSTTTDFRGNNNLKGELRTYQNNYNSPVVIGQVMSSNDERWSTFWARGENRNIIPSTNTLYTGKLVSEDSDRNRLDETLAYLVVESGITMLDGANIQAGITPNSVKNPSVYTYTGSLNIGTLILSAAGIKGANGGWPVIHQTPEANSFESIFDEDQIQDEERTHTAEEVSFIIIE